jgi:hypothetical protein
LKKGDDMKNKTQLFLANFLIVFILILVGCDNFNSGRTGSSDATSEAVYTYPVTYGGGGTVTEAGTTYEASITFTANGDDTCSLVATYQMWTEDFKTGARSLDTIGWYVYGKHDMGSQACTFKRCNDAGYTASGEMIYYSTSTEPTSITCSLDGSGATIKVNGLGK